MTNEGLKLVAAMFSEEDIEAAFIAFHNYVHKRPNHDPIQLHDFNPIDLEAGKLVLRYVMGEALLSAQRAGRVAVNNKEEAK